MRVSDLMTMGVKSCRGEDTLHRAAQIMWENDCGCVPVADSGGFMTGIITDRDIAMAAYLQGKPLDAMRVDSVAAKAVFAVRESDSVEAAEEIMRQKQVRRIPVLDREGRMKGLISLGDIARHQPSGDDVAKTMAAICQPHQKAWSATPRSV